MPSRCLLTKSNKLLMVIEPAKLNNSMITAHCTIWASAIVNQWLLLVTSLGLLSDIVLRYTYRLVSITPIRRRCSMLGKDQCSFEFTTGSVLICIISSTTLCGLCCLPSTCSIPLLNDSVPGKLFLLPVSSPSPRLQSPTGLAHEVVQALCCLPSDL